MEFAAACSPKTGERQGGIAGDSLISLEETTRYPNADSIAFGLAKPQKGHGEAGGSACQYHPAGEPTKVLRTRARHDDGFSALCLCSNVRRSVGPRRASSAGIPSSGKPPAPSALPFVRNVPGNANSFAATSRSGPARKAANSARLRAGNWWKRKRPQFPTTQGRSSPTLWYTRPGTNPWAGLRRSCFRVFRLARNPGWS
jgi:hypothetical protein